MNAKECLKAQLKFNNDYLNSCLEFSAMVSLASHTFELAAASATTDSFFAPFFPFFLELSIKNKQINFPGMNMCETNSWEKNVQQDSQYH